MKMQTVYENAKNLEPRFSAPAQRLLRGLYLLVCFSLLSPAFLLVSCKSVRGPEIIVPDYDTAREQARAADLQYERARKTIADGQKEIELQKAKAAAAKAINKFPEDLEYIPAVQLLLATINFQLEEYKSAEREYRRVIDNYPNIADVHSEALLGLAQTLKQQKRFKENKQVLLTLIELYEEFEDPRIKELVRIARIEYSQIETN